MKSYIKIVLTSFSVLLIIFFCGSGKNSVGIDSDKQIKFKNYSVHSPIGDDWECQPNIEKQSVTFYRQSDEKNQSFDSRNTFIDVYCNYTTMPTKNIDRSDFANGFMENEFQIMISGAGQTPYGAPSLIAKDTLVINEKLFYRMNYKYSKQPGQGHLYIYLPNKFENNGIFYLFLIVEFGNNSLKNSSYNFDQINNVLETFICDEDE